MIPLSALLLVRIRPVVPTSFRSAMSGLVDVSNCGFRTLNRMVVSKNLSALPNPYLLSGVSGPVLCPYPQKASHAGDNMRRDAVPIENTQVMSIALFSVWPGVFVWGREARREVNRKRFRLNLIGYAPYII